MNKSYLNPIEQNDAMVKEMKERAKKGFQHGEITPYLTSVAEKYDVSFGKTQQLYYNRVRGKENEESEVRETQLEMESTIKSIIPLNYEQVRIIEYKEKIHVVARDLLHSVGIKYSSSFLSDLLTEEDRIITPIPSSHGLAKTLIISIDTAIAFLEIVSMQHTNINIRSSAKRAIPVLKNIQSGHFEVEEREVREEVTPIQQLHKRKIYRSGEKVMVRILQIGEKTVEVETTDDEQVRGIIYIADVADVYVADLHDFFEEGEVVEATIKRYDERINRLSLTTLGNTFMKLKSKYKTTMQVNQPSKEEMNLQNLSPAPYEQVVKEEGSQVSIEPPISHEMERILDYLQNEVKMPFISEEAKAKLQQLLQTNSLFELSVAMVKLGEEFKPDVSVLFMQQLEEYLKKK